MLVYAFTNPAATRIVVKSRCVLTLATLVGGGGGGAVVLVFRSRIGSALIVR